MIMFIVVFLLMTRSQDINVKEHHINMATKTNKIVEMKNLMNKKTKDGKRRTKVVLVFNEISQLEGLIKDMKEYDLTINQVKLKDVEERKIKSNRKRREEQQIENIPLGYKTICVLFKYLNLLKTSTKLKNVKVTDILVTKGNKDIYNKLDFNEQENDLRDTTGYFTGHYVNESLEKEGKMYQTGLYHINGLNEEQENTNNKNIRKLVYYIATLEKMSVKSLLEQDCELNSIDKLLFYNDYPKDKRDDVTVCMCKDNQCKSCEGVYKVSRGSFVV